ncbi:acyl-CoA thioesterase [Natronorarus salvus]|uniref:acyl-CoA thioesterase n=1 Tax=Natronorarus salvus TaxID=3117733 RepID=UPI002F26C6A5
MPREFTTKIEVRFRDLDPYAHVNHAVYATYLEQARTRYYKEVFDKLPYEIDSVIVRLEIDYRKPVTIEDTLTVGIELSDIGRSSISRAYTITNGAETVAEAKTKQVFIDVATETSKPVPDDHRAALEAYHFA